MPRPHHLLLALLLLSTTATAKETDLAKAYPATIDWEEGAPPRDWTTGPDDAWELKSFSYAYRDDLKLECGAATAVFGVSGTNVVWAVVLPEKPGRLKAAGDEVEFSSLWLRFHPARVGDLFPRRTVKGRGDVAALIPALRIGQAKINGSMQWDNLPVVPKREWLVVDADTPDGQRRFLIVNEEQKTVKPEPYFSDKPVPPAPAGKISKADAAAAFDGAYDAFDKEYAMFGLRPEVDFASLRKAYRPLALKAETAYEVAGAIALLLRPLRDLHVWVKCGDTWLPGYSRFRLLNANWNATKAMLTGVNDTGKELAFGKTSDGLGYVVVWGLTKPELPAAFDEALGSLKDAKGLVVDLRFNGGGGEDLAQEIAGRFTKEARVYSRSRYRNGRRHDQLTEAFPRTLEPRGPWTWEKPVVVLTGRKTMSSAESFALMFAECPPVTTVGAPTAGSSANPRRLELPGGIVVNLPRWIDLDPDGNPIDEAGVKPDVPVDAAPAAFRTGDPVMAKALEILREKTK